MFNNFAQTKRSLALMERIMVTTQALIPDLELRSN